MKRNRLFRALLACAALACQGSSCKEEEAPQLIPIPEKWLKDFGCFGKGSYWIYEKKRTNEKDTMYISGIREVPQGVYVIHFNANSSEIGYGIGSDYRFPKVDPTSEIYNYSISLYTQHVTLQIVRFLSVESMDSVFGGQTSSPVPFSTYWRQLPSGETGTIFLQRRRGIVGFTLPNRDTFELLESNIIYTR